MTTPITSTTALNWRLRNNTAILAVNNVGGAGLAFVISVAIGRGLGAQGLGQYSFIMAWIAPLIALADFGMGTLITRDVAQNQDHALPLLRTATRAMLIIAALLMIGTWLLAPVFQRSPPVMAGLSILAFLIILDPWYGLYTALFRTFQRMWPILLVNVGGLALQLPLIVLAIGSGMGLVGLAVVVVGINVLQLFATWALWRVTSRSVPLSRKIGVVNSPSVYDVLRRAWPFALAAVIYMLQTQLNVLLLEHLSGDVAVGVYSAASPFLEAGKLIPTALFGALFPALSSLAVEPVAMRRTFVKAAWLLALFAVVYGVSMTLLGSTVLRLTYDPGGTQFAGAATVLTILSWSLIPTLLKGVTTLYLYGLKREHFVNIVLCGALIVQVVLGWMLIRRWGASGAALTVSIVEGGSVLCLLFGTRRPSLAHATP